MAHQGPGSNGQNCLTPHGFRGNYSFLSNFHPCVVSFGGFVFICSEGAYAAQKTTDECTRRAFQTYDGPTAKREGQKLVLRNDWPDIRVQVMRDIVAAKFTQNPDLTALLLQTGDGILVEVNTWGDHFWGVCGEVGENRLGLILMEVRESLKGRADWCAGR